jgi:quercetin dioxygenase-like cupin family protein
MKRVHLLVSAVLFSASLLAQPARAQDPVKLDPKFYKVLLDNDRVRVLDVRLNPGEKSAQHSHPGYVTYALSESKVKLTLADGKTEVIESKRGKALWHDPVTLTVENIGPTESHILVIELKEPPK